MPTRREFLVAGGLALAGHVLPLGGPSPGRRGEGIVHEIVMGASPGGSRVWFDPVGLRVESGAAVRWVLGQGVHTTTAYHPDNGDRARRIPRGARSWDSGYLSEPDASFQLTFERVGVYDYFCRPHEAAGMAGRIIVVPAGAEDPTDPDVGETSPLQDPGYGTRGVGRAALQTLPTVMEVMRRGHVPARSG